MAETLTESFCERCGTRYEFQAPTRLNPLRKTRGLIGGLRNYLTSQDALSDALGDAMRTEEDSLASAQLDAFHESFNFCIDCRQYTCLNCWNDDAGRCRSCKPVPGTDDLVERLAASAAVTTPLPEDGTAWGQGEMQPAVGLEAWPSSDLPADEAIASNGHAAEEWPAAEAFPDEPLVAEVEPEPEPVVAEVEPEPIVAEVEFEPVPEPVAAEVEPEPEPLVAEIEFEPEPEPIVAEVEPEPEPIVAEVEVEPEPEPVAAEVEPEPTRRPLRVVAWDEDSAYQVGEPEPIVPEPVAAEIEPEPEPVAAEIEPEPEPVAAEVAPERVAPPIRSITETILPFPTPAARPPIEDDRAAAVADSPELAARREQLDRLGLGDPTQPLTADPSEPLPYRSRGATVTQAELARQAALQGSFWEASAREVASATGRVGVQNCGQCGLSLSANARFCRRCGTRQAQSA